MLKKIVIFSLISCSVSLAALDHQKLDKLMTHYIKNDDDQFKELLQEIVANSKTQAELYTDLQTLSAKFNDFNAFYTKKRDKRTARGRTTLTNSIFYSVAGLAALVGSYMYAAQQQEQTAQLVIGGAGVGVAAIFGLLARANLIGSVLDYNFFAKLVRKNNKFWSIVEKLKQETAMQMEVQIPIAEGVKLEID